MKKIWKIAKRRLSPRGLMRYFGMQSMKKSFFLALFCLLVPVTTISADSYGILVNGNKYYAGTLNPTPMDPSFDEYQCLGVPV